MLEQLPDMIHSQRSVQPAPGQRQRQAGAGHFQRSRTVSRGAREPITVVNNARHNIDPRRFKFLEDIGGIWREIDQAVARVQLCRILDRTVCLPVAKARDGVHFFGKSLRQ